MNVSWWKVDRRALKLAHVATQDSPDAENVSGDSQRAGAQHDWNNIPFPAKHPEECDCAYHKRKPVDISTGRKYNVNSEPDSEIQNHAHNCGGDS